MCDLLLNITWVFRFNYEEFDTRRLILLSLESLSVLTQVVHTLAWFCDITTSFKANHGRVCNLHTCDVETRSLLWTYTENKLHINVGNILGVVVKL